jgi:hypothetical protein
VAKGYFGAIIPFNGLWRPVVLIIVDIGPLRLFPIIVVLNAGRHVDAVLLF